MIKHRDRTEDGAALMLSLWALFLLSAMVISWALDINSQLTVSGNANRMLEAEAMACSGAEVALHPAVKPGSSVLKGHPTKTTSFEARITGEGGRLNLNWLLAGENPARIEVLRKYLEVRGIDLNERDHMIDCLLDWFDPDNLVRLNGAEAEGDYRPANGRLTRVQDLTKIKGWQEFTSSPEWDRDFTVTETGAIDLVWASREVLLALPGMSDQRVDQFLTFRRGPDGIENTEDDPKIERDDARNALGFTTPQFDQLKELISVNFPVLRVVSVGKSGDVTRVVQMVIRTGGPIPILIPGTWKEL